MVREGIASGPELGLVLGGGEVSDGIREWEETAAEYVNRVVRERFMDVVWASPSCGLYSVRSSFA